MSSTRPMIYGIPQRPRWQQRIVEVMFYAAVILLIPFLVLVMSWVMPKLADVGYDQGYCDGYADALATGNFGYTVKITCD